MAEQQRDKDIIKTPPLLVDPIFDLPVGLDEGGYLIREHSPNTDDVGEPGSGPDDETSPDAPLNEPGEEDAATGGHRPIVLDPRPLGAPVEITVKSQTLRASSDGTFVVDVVLEFPDQEGATGYEVRLAK